MLEGIKILIDRLNGDDKDVDKWINKAQDDVLYEHEGTVDYFTAEEKAAVREALVARFRREFNADIINMISDDDEEGPKKGGPLTKKMLINQAQLQLIKAMEAQEKREGGPVQW